MKILLATDHAGFELKEYLKSFLEKLGYETEDFGAYEYDETDDYPDFIEPLAVAIGKDPEHLRGIVLGGSGQGEAIDANRFSGVRAAVYYGGNTDIVRLSREHNNANVLSLGARFVTQKEAETAVKLWITTDFSGNARHVRRIEKIDDMIVG